VTVRSVFAERAASLRQSFDQAFARPPASAPEEADDFLLVRVSGQSYALQVSEIGGVAKGRSVFRIPTRRAELLGLAGIRGMVIYVYSLAMLLGLAEDATSISWLALNVGSDPVAVAFQQLDGFVRVRRSDVHSEEIPDAAGRLVRRVIKMESIVRPVVDLQRIFNAARRTAGGAGSTRSGS
jgi:chemotaxis signal transduction protein